MKKEDENINILVLVIKRVIQRVRIKKIEKQQINYEREQFLLWFECRQYRWISDSLALGTGTQNILLISVFLPLY